MQLVLKIGTLKGAKFVKTLPLRVQNGLSGPTLKDAKSKKKQTHFGGASTVTKCMGVPSPGAIIAIQWHS